MKGNMSKWLAVGLVLSLLVVSVIGACAKPAPKPEVIEWRLLEHSAQLTHPSVQNLDIPFCNEVAERSGGRLKVTVHLEAELGYKGEEALRNLQAGLTEIGVISTGPNSTDMPIIGVFDLPTLYGTAAELAKGYEATEHIWQRELAKWDIIPIGFFMVDEMTLFSKKPVNTLEDLKGLKIRAYYPELADLLVALGASTVYVPFPEQYTSLQRGVMDATITGPANAAALKFWEVIDYIMAGIGVAYAPNIVGVSKVHFDKLPTDLQEIVLDAAKKNFTAKAPSLSAEMTTAGLKQFEAEGVTIVKITPEDREQIVKVAEEQVWTKWIEMAGPVGKELVDTILKAIR